jgi:hypothetical protein
MRFGHPDEMLRRPPGWAIRLGFYQRELVTTDAHAEATTIRRGLGMALKRFLVTVEGPNLKDVSEAELLELPEVGETIETRFGTCIITRAELSPDSFKYTGKIVCRLP